MFDSVPKAFMYSYANGSSTDPYPLPNRVGNDPFALEKTPDSELQHCCANEDTDGHHHRDLIFGILDLEPGSGLLDLLP